jgi:hypothetical protein
MVNCGVYDSGILRITESEVLIHASVWMSLKNAVPREESRSKRLNIIWFLSCELSI